MRNQLKQGHEEPSALQRNEAFSDGVFAIAITLLVLEIKIPHTVDSAHGLHLSGALADSWPEYFAYVFSFITIGIYWANHHYITRLFKRTDHWFNLLNVLFLMCISFLPLPTAVLGQYIMNPVERHTAVIFYNFGLLLPAVAWSLTWFYGARNYLLIDENLDPKFVRKLSRQYMGSNVFYLASIVVAVFSSVLGVAMAIGQTLLYLLPPRPAVYRDGTQVDTADS